MPQVTGDLRGLLARLEIPACKCPLVGPGGEPARCPHAAATPPHALTIGEWAELLRAADPKNYCDRIRGEPSGVLSREARVLVMRDRLRRGLSLWHPGDRWRRGDDRVGVEAGHGRNGSTYERGLICG